MTRMLPESDPFYRSDQDSTFRKLGESELVDVIGRRSAFIAEIKAIVHQSIRVVCTFTVRVIFR
jgi:hypothetical protein